MIAHLSGTLRQLTSEGLIMDVGGVGYEILLPVSLHRQMSSIKIGESLDLHILTVLNLPMGGKATLALVGFFYHDEKAFFEELIGVSGIGVKAAAKALARPITEVAAAVVAGDASLLKSLPGIGPKKAAEIINKLAPAAAQLSARPSTAAQPVTGVWAEARDVLLQLSYRSAEVEEMLGKVRSRLGDEPQLDEILAEVWKG